MLLASGSYQYEWVYRCIFANLSITFKDILTYVQMPALQYMIKINLI